MTEEKPDTKPRDVPVNKFHQRREKIVAEIQANRRGEYTVPTWVLTLILVAIIGGFAALIYLT